VNAHSVLLQGLDRLGIVSTPGQLRRLEGYRLELERWNRAFGFVKAEGEELVVRHFLDSLAGLDVIAGLAAAGRIADVGSGAGFPGVPLAIMLPQASLTLVEPASRKAAFLRGVAIVLQLANVTVAERQLREVQGPFDLVTFRAFRPLTAGGLAGLRRLLAPGGAIVAYKGRRERVDGELRGMGMQSAGPEEVAVVALQVPFLQEERHLLILRPPHPSDSTAS
jgi:16S rRNA (guanine527-N7)-methyltransferase